MLIMKRKTIIVYIFLSMLILTVGTVVATRTITEEQQALYEGWNLVHGLAHPDLIFNKEYMESVKATYYYDPIGKEYIRFYPDMEDEKINNLEGVIEDTQNVFWVYLDRKISKLEYNAEDIETLKSVHLREGWNFVGITEDFIDKTLNELKGNCIFEKVAFWNSQEQDWIIIPDDVPEDKRDSPFDKSVLNRALTIKVKSECNLDFQNIIGPPSMPSPTEQEGECTDSEGVGFPESVMNFWRDLLCK